MRNTMICYTYRDKTGASVGHEAVVAGKCDGETARRILSGMRMDDSAVRYFIPGQVGLCDAQDHLAKGHVWDQAIDTPWHSLDGIFPSDCAPTVKITLAELVERVGSVVWNEQHKPWFVALEDARLAEIDRANSPTWWWETTDIVTGFGTYMRLGEMIEIVTVGQDPHNDQHIVVERGQLVLAPEKIADWLDTVGYELKDGAVMDSVGEIYGGSRALVLIVDGAVASGAHDVDDVEMIDMSDINDSGLGLRDYIREQIVGCDLPIPVVDAPFM